MTITLEELRGFTARPNRRGVKRRVQLLSTSAEDLHVEMLREKDRIRAASWRARNPERSKASVAKWRAKNAEKMRAADKAWKKRNAAKVRISNARYMRERYRRDPAAAKEQQRIYREANRDAINARRRARYQALRAA